ncbi:pirin family protein [Acinetobacter rudis]|uniref:Pirin family protein n=1 Tax=Acinetobacter rudis CIP 110305 TaxID=421052 RepID=S3MTN1_9GAMM|nr:pirin family protein [Acinetobacter rudis]EPF69923.1 hypothetical protein F945_03485 [Acinetobacter rudis CIP 110305]
MSDHNLQQKTVAQFEQDLITSGMQPIALRSAEIGQGTKIKRALPSRLKRMIGAWCFLDHAGPAHFPAGEGLDVGPHPHIGLQTFTWMIKGSMMHRDSLGYAQLIQPKQVNLMTAGQGISHTEVAPATETEMHSVQLWIALPDDKKDMPPQFDHYPDLPVVQQDQVEYTVLVGEFLDAKSPVQVHSELVGVDLVAQAATQATLPLNPSFEYALLVLEGEVSAGEHHLSNEHMLVLNTGMQQLNLKMSADAHAVLIGGVPFESPVLLWWNFVGRTQEEMEQAREQWVNHDARFGVVADYEGERLIAPPLPDRMRASK